MRRRRRQRIEDAKSDMTPMLDVVFILLIFFVVTATFIQEEAIRLEAPPPSGTSGESRPSIVVNLDSNGLIKVNNKAAGLHSVRARIEEFKAQLPDAALIIQVHPKAKNGLLLLIRDAAYEAGFSDDVNVTLQEETKVL